ncbi:MULTISPECIES: polysaccharide biosynthesis/export family protein [unclassified Caulobacter]|uniref:polysaccharide biosynthesis/export family protein n=1 Tax=unclassified Caulobacter TaxID=2648921 RepID=UPI001E535230|nr:MULTISPECIES: polysaccharide biosynthesis/export family protein [unclassified Caulobacter]
MFLSMKPIVTLGLGLAAMIAAPVMTMAPSIAQAQTPAAVTGSYRLGAGDKIRLITYGEESLSGDFEVSGAGTIALPLIGEIKAMGLTPSELQASISNALRGGYLKDPRVSVEVSTYRPFYILGEVNKPGEYPYANGLTVMNAVAMANGFTYRANTRKVIVRHGEEASDKEYPLNSSLPVAPGDTIRIKERLF